jgi:hypothetical protein
MIWYDIIIFICVYKYIRKYTLMSKKITHIYILELWVRQQYIYTWISHLQDSPASNTSISLWIYCRDQELQLTINSTGADEQVVDSINKFTPQLTPTARFKPTIASQHANRNSNDNQNGSDNILYSGEKTLRQNHIHHMNINPKGNKCIWKVQIYLK